MNEYELIYTTEMARAFGETAKDTAEALIIPTAKSIGDNVGLLIEGVFGWLGCWGETQRFKQLKYKDEFKQTLYSKIENINQDQLKEPEMKVVGPAIEASKFYYEEEYYRDMFSNLIAASCDRRKSNIIHPSYVEIIKQLSPLDAKLLSMFKYHNTYPMASIREVQKDGVLTPCTQYLFYFKDKSNEFNTNEHLSLTFAYTNLVRLGLIIQNQNIIELAYNYDELKNHFIYLAFDSIKHDKENNIVMSKFRMELTQFGQNFFTICI